MGLHAGWGVLVRLEDETLAVFEFFSRRVLERDEDLVHAFSSIGRQVGQFIARKRAGEGKGSTFTVALPREAH